MLNLLQNTKLFNYLNKIIIHICENYEYNKMLSFKNINNPFF
jgi:hypothetical protein